MKLRVFGVLLLAFAFSRCAVEPKADWKPIAEPWQSHYEERMMKLYHTIKLLGDTPYEWGGTSPKWGMDCSAFTQYVMKEVGVKIPRTVREQAKVGEWYMTKHLRAGDLIFFDASQERAGLDHVGIYLGKGYFAHSRSPVGVEITRLEDYEHDVQFGRRVLESRIDVWESQPPVEAKLEVPEVGEIPQVVTVPEVQSAPIVIVRNTQEPKKPVVNKGIIIRMELLGSDSVKYVAQREDSSTYEFDLDLKNHLDTLKYYGNPLGREIEWNDEWFWLNED
jgi:hypothetical protein